MRATKLFAGRPSADSHIVPVVFEDGVLRPLRPVLLKNHARVDIAILSKTAWARILRTLLRTVHARPTRLRPAAIEAEITRAAEEARRLRRRRS